MDTRQAEQQLNTLSTQRQRLRRKLVRPALLALALAAFGSLALRAASENASLLFTALIPIVFALIAKEHGAHLRGTGLARTLLTLLAVTAWIIAGSMFGYLNPFGWTYVWPLVGVIVAAPFVLLAWTAKL